MLKIEFKKIIHSNNSRANDIKIEPGWNTEFSWLALVATLLGIELWWQMITLNLKKTCIITFKKGLWAKSSLSVQSKIWILYETV